MNNFPKRPSDLTEPWVEGLMSRWGALASGSIARMRVDGDGLESGFFGDVVRLHIDFDGAAADTPSSVIAKFPPSDERAFDEGKRRGYYNREVAFYRDFAPSCGLRVPACYGAEYDSDGGGNVLLLEDLSGLRAGTDPSPSWRRDAEAVMQQMAAFNALWWGREAEISFPWLAASDEGAERFQETFTKAWPAVERLFGAQVDSDSLARGARVADHVADIKHHLASAPYVFLHSDLRNENLFFIDGDAPKVAALDWQHCRSGRAACDAAAYLFGLGQRLSADEEAELLHVYHDALLSGGVSGYSWSDCQRDFSLAMLSRFVNVSSSFAHVEPESDAGQKAVRYLSECTLPVFLRHASVLETF